MSNYTTAAKVATLLNVDVSQIHSDLIANANDLVDTVLGYSLGIHTIEDELYDGSNTDELLLNNFPVSEITKVEWEDADRVWHELTDDEYVLYSDEGKLKLKLLPNSDWYSIVDYHSGDALFEEGTQNWRISYKYGISSIPKDIELLAGLYAIQQYRLREGTATGDISSEKIGDYSVSYDTAGSAASTNVDKLIDLIVSKYNHNDLGIKGV